MSKPSIIITMAGEGRRFREVGFQIPKFEIVVRGKSLFEWSLASLTAFTDWNLIFVARAQDNAERVIAPTCAKLGFESWSVVPLGSPTVGQAVSALAAKGKLADPLAPIAIYNIDTAIDPGAISPGSIKGAGWIPVFRAAGEQWSFVRADKDWRVEQITEKVRISDLATVGFYYFSSFSLFEEAYQKTQWGDYREHFVAPVYQSIISDSNTPVFAQLLPSEVVHVLGTPEDVKLFAPEFILPTR